MLSVYTSGDPLVNGGNLAQTEVHLYGVGRMGMLKRSVDVQGAPAVTATAYPLSGDSITFVRGNKLFELTNHLGNVLATISDKRYGVSADDSTVTYYNPEVVSANDYYPFGSLQPGRTYNEPNTGRYRYGFNGKETDNDVKGEGNQVDYGARIYDPRVGRFYSVDPLIHQYAYYSPYLFAGNSPILNLDVDGMSSNPSQPNTSSNPNDLHARAAAMIKSLESQRRRIQRDIKTAEKVLGAVNKLEKDLKQTQAELNAQRDAIKSLSTTITHTGQQLVKKFDELAAAHEKIKKANEPAHFGAEVSGKVTAGLQAGVKVESHGFEAGVDVNAGNVELASGAAGYNPEGNSPGKWGASGDYVGKDGQVKLEQGVKAGVGYKVTDDVKVEAGFSQKISTVYSGGSVMTSTSSSWDASAKVGLSNDKADDQFKKMGSKDGVASAPKLEAKAELPKGEEKGWFGINLSGKVALVLGLEGSVKIGFYYNKNKFD